MAKLHLVIKSAFFVEALTRKERTCCSILNFLWFLFPESFMQYMVTFDDLCNNPLLLSDPKLVIRINDRYL